MVNEGGTIPRRASRSPKNVTNTFFNSFHTSFVSKKLRFEREGTKLASCPSNLVTPLFLPYCGQFNPRRCRGPLRKPDTEAKAWVYFKYAATNRKSFWQRGKKARNDERIWGMSRRNCAAGTELASDEAHRKITIKRSQRRYINTSLCNIIARAWYRKRSQWAQEGIENIKLRKIRGWRHDVTQLWKRRLWRATLLTSLVLDRLSKNIQRRQKKITRERHQWSSSSCFPPISDQAAAVFFPPTLKVSGSVWKTHSSVTLRCRIRFRTDLPFVTWQRHDVRNVIGGWRHEPSELSGARPGAVVALALFRRQVSEQAPSLGGFQNGRDVDRCRGRRTPVLGRALFAPPVLRRG